MDTTNKINSIIQNKRLKDFQFKELKTIYEYCIEKNVANIRPIIDWFVFLQVNEITGWRNKKNTLNIVDNLINSKIYPVSFYSLFCPSYKKGDNLYGFRIDTVGATTVSGISNLTKFTEYTESLGFKVDEPVAVFFDLALEQFDRLQTYDWKNELESNIQNFCDHLPPSIKFEKLSDEPSLFKLDCFKFIPHITNTPDGPIIEIKKI